MALTGRLDGELRRRVRSAGRRRPAGARASTAASRASWRPPADPASVDDRRHARLRAARTARAVPGVGRQRHTRLAGVAEGEGQVHDRPRLAGRSVAQVPRPPHEHLAEPLPRCGQRVCARRAGQGVDARDGSRSALPDLARAYKEAGIEWIAVGDENYGEGSSREHAAMEPRFMGGRVGPRPLVRRGSHEANLKKQGCCRSRSPTPPTTTRSAPTTWSTSSGSTDLAPGQHGAGRRAPRRWHDRRVRGQPHDVRRAHRVVPSGLGVESARVEAVNRFETTTRRARHRARRHAVPGGHPHRGRRRGRDRLRRGRDREVARVHRRGRGRGTRAHVGREPRRYCPPRRALRRQGPPGQRRRSARRDRLRDRRHPAVRPPRTGADDLRPRALGVRDGLGRGRNPRHRVPARPPTACWS